MPLEMRVCEENDGGREIDMKIIIIELCVWTLIIHSGKVKNYYVEKAFCKCEPLLNFLREKLDEWKYVWIFKFLHLVMCGMNQTKLIDLFFVL